MALTAPAMVKRLTARANAPIPEIVTEKVPTVPATRTPAPAALAMMIPARPAPAMMTPVMTIPAQAKVPAVVIQDMVEMTQGATVAVTMAAAMVDQAAVTMAVGVEAAATVKPFN